MTDNLDFLRFPIGPFTPPETYSPELLAAYIETIAQFPQKIKSEVQGMSDAQLDTPYRPGGWTVRQVLHHCADSHLNSLLRFKLALTEDAPTIKPYNQDLWVELPDSKNMPIAPSLAILEGLHQRWSVLLKALSAADLDKTFVHPEYGKIYTLKYAMALYAWHCDDHLAHIVNLKKRENWI